VVYIGLVEDFMKLTEVQYRTKHAVHIHLAIQLLPPHGYTKSKSVKQYIASGMTNHNHKL